VGDVPCGNVDRLQGVPASINNVSGKEKKKEKRKKKKKKTKKKKKHPHLLARGIHKHLAVLKDELLVHKALEGGDANVRHLQVELNAAIRDR
jgi:hypothetical protein